MVAVTSKSAWKAVSVFLVLKDVINAGGLLESFKTDLLARRAAMSSEWQVDYGGDSGVQVHALREGGSKARAVTLRVASLR